MDVFQSVEHVIDIKSLRLIVCFITLSSSTKIKNKNSFFYYYFIIFQ